MGKHNFDIESYCRITNDKVVVNNELLMQKGESGDWLADIYHHIGMQYPKFFKMDRLCKVGTLAAELVLKDKTFDHETVKADWAVILMNSASSLDDDRQYQETIRDRENYYPSPSIFVYTLANIVTGEIAIRHKIGGESSFYVFEHFDGARMDELAARAFDDNPELKTLLCGWVDYDTDGCDVLLCSFIRKENKKSSGNITEYLKQLYKNQ